MFAWSIYIATELAVYNFPAGIAGVVGCHPFDTVKVNIDTSAYTPSIEL